MKKLHSTGILLAAVMLLVTEAADARQMGHISGAVVDESDGALPGATVVLALSAADSRQAITDDRGVFRFDNVPPGSATLRVELAGFQTTEMPVTIATATATPVTVRLTVALEEEVEVAGSETPDVLSATRNADAVELDLEAMRNIPTDSQNLMALVEQFTSAAGSVSVVIDGTEGGTLQVPAAAIHRLTINRSPYAAEFSRPGKARVDVVTEIGSRRFFHGSGAVFVRNSALDARNAFAAAHPDLDRRLFEGSIGGPLPATGFSFFVSGERLTNAESAIVNAQTVSGAVRENVPTLQQRVTTLGRIDYRPNKLRSVNLRYDLFDDASDNSGVGGVRLAQQGYSTTERRHRVRLNEHEIVSDRVVNDVFLEVSRAVEIDGEFPLRPAVVVPGAFSGGAPQTFREDRSTSVQLQDLVALSLGGQMVKVGGRAKAKWNSLRDASNFGGTYEFANLDELARGTPFVFRRNEGNPTTSFVTSDAAGYAEIDLRPLPHLGVTAGLRYDWQSSLSDMNNVAPRISAAFAPGGGKIVLRGGVGLFYEDLPDAATGRSLLFDGRIRELVLGTPPFPEPPVGQGPGSAGSAAAVWRVSDALVTPSVMQASISIERPLSRRSGVSAEYSTTRGSHLFRARNINAPHPLSGLRPHDGAVEINQIESTGSSRSHALSLMFRGRIQEFKGTLQYTLSRATDDTSGVFDLPANNYDLRPERGRADFDRRHRFSMTGVYEFPDQAVRLGAVVALASGAPYDIITGFDDNGDFVANDRPAGVSRNTGQGPGRAQVDMRLTKALRAPRPTSSDPESRKREYVENLELNLDVFNVFNRLNPTAYIGVLSSPSFGRAVAASRPRTLQVSMRYRF